MKGRGKREKERERGRERERERPTIYLTDPKCLQHWGCARLKQRALKSIWGFQMEGEHPSIWTIIYYYLSVFTSRKVNQKQNSQDLN